MTENQQDNKVRRYTLTISFTTDYDLVAEHADLLYSWFPTDFPVNCYISDTCLRDHGLEYDE